MVNADKTKPGSDHILSREERIREIQSFNLLSDVFMSVALRMFRRVSIFFGS